MANTGNTQDLVDIKDIRNDVVLMKDGTMLKAIIVGGTSFALKSQEEQNLISQSYQNFLNSLNFQIQIIIHSRKINITPYLKRLEEREAQESSPLLKEQIAEYRDFIQKFIADNAIMSKTFLVVVPFSPIALQEASGIMGSLPFFKKSKQQQSAEDEAKFAENIQQLDQRVSQVMNGLTNIGLEPAVLNTEQLVELFYNFYNPETVEKESLPLGK